MGAFTGGDPGEGLDLQGHFTYAVNVGTAGPAGTAGDARFTPDTVTGVQVIAPNEIPNWNAASYGATSNDTCIAAVMSSIRWADAPRVVRVRLSVEQGVEYKLQLLFAETCCPGRGFNVVIDGRTAVTNFIPATIQAGDDGDFEGKKFKMGAVITDQFTAARDPLEIVLDGPAADSPDISDHNAILNGLTLERISPVTDVDGDGLQDEWEKRYFGNLDAGPNEDPDHDGLTNLEEQALGSDPTQPDSDGDGLSDGDEAHTHRTDPNSRDTDGDGLSDGDEVNVDHTDPTRADTDGDGFSDYDELSLGTDPADKGSFPVQTLIGVATGGDAGEGLDLDGQFVYAVNLSSAGAAGKIRDADFTGDDAPGVTVTAGGDIPAWFNNLNYGDSPNDDVLEMVMSSIRWSAAAGDPPTVTLALGNLEAGATYKLQLLFAEQSSPTRAFDVLIDGTRRVREFNPARYQGGAGRTDRAVVISHSFIARSATLTVVLDGRRVVNPLFTNHDPILNGATLELIAPNADSDADGLPDAWETGKFGNLTAAADGDPDADGLTNRAEFDNGTDPLRADSDADGLSDSQELAKNTNPNMADTDGDGLSDGLEANTYATDPNNPDMDGDGLSDGAEVLVYKTNPKARDTDSDGVDDGVEILFGTDPNVADVATQFTNIVVQSFIGADPGEGLDLQGNFLYAFNVGSPGAAGRAGDADFTADNAPGIRVTAQNDIPNWHAPEYGDTPDDDVLEFVMQSIRWSAAPAKVRVELAVVAGATYKLQLLFAEQCCPGRGFDVLAEGQLLVDEFNPASVQGGAANTSAGAVIAAEFVARRSTLVIVLDGTTATSPDITDHNPTLSGVTLETLKPGVAPSEPPLKLTRIARDTTGLSLSFDSVATRRYAIEYSPSLAPGSWTALNTNVVSTGTNTVYLDNDPGRLDAPRGFWRVRSL